MGLPHVAGDTSAPAAAVHTATPDTCALCLVKLPSIHHQARAPYQAHTAGSSTHALSAQLLPYPPVMIMACAMLSLCCCHVPLLLPGLDTNPDRPDDKLPYRGAWLWIGPEMIHLMELPNPDPTERAKRPGEPCLSTPSPDSFPRMHRHAAGTPLPLNMICTFNTLSLFHKHQQLLG